MLCILAEGQIENFSLDTRAAAAQVDRALRRRDGAQRPDPGRQADLQRARPRQEGDAGAGQRRAPRFSAPMRIGFRQLPLERWMASPLYSLKFANPQRAASQHKPFTVTLERAEFDAEPDEDAPEERRQHAEAIKEEFRIVDVVDAQGGDACAPATSCCACRRWAPTTPTGSTPASWRCAERERTPWPTTPSSSRPAGRPPNHGRAAIDWFETRPTTPRSAPSARS